MKLGLLIHSRPFKKVFVKRNQNTKQKQKIFGFVKYMRKQNILQKKNFGRLYQRELPRKEYFQNMFEYINLINEGNIPKTILTDLETYKKYTDFTIKSIPTELLHEDETISKILNVFWFLYSNGGIYLNKKITTHPSIFIKNNFVGVNIHLFSCVKNSPLMKKILDETYSIIENENTIEAIIQSFNKNIEGNQFNKSINFLI